MTSSWLALVRRDQTLIATDIATSKSYQVALPFGAAHVAVSEFGDCAVVSKSNDQLGLVNPSLRFDSFNKTW